MNKIKVAVVAGGDSSEYQISIAGANFVIDSLDKTKYTPYLAIVSKMGWYVEIDGKKLDIDKNDFSFVIDEQKVCFDVAYINIHGTPGENGVLQSYFELISLPYTTCGVDSSVVTFNKMVCKRVVNSASVNTAKDIIITKGEAVDAKHIADTLSLPLFVKPNASGSSFGVSKVLTIEEIEPAIAEAFKESDTVIIEEYLAGREFGQGIFADNGELVCLPLTEIISKTAFFDYKAKYEGLSSEITPAELDKAISDEIADISKKIYKVTQCKGVVRIDFIVRDGVPYMVEVNTTPGMSPASIVPQQVTAMGKELAWFYDRIIINTLKTIDNE